MGLKIRLRQQGRTNAKAYRLVLADSKSPRDGKYVETLGYYHPLQEGDREAKVDKQRIAYWLEMGAEPTEKAAALIVRLSPEADKMLRERKIAKRTKALAARKKKK